MAINSNDEDSAEKTEMLCGDEEIMKRGLETFAHKRQDTCSEGVIKRKILESIFLYVSYMYLCRPFSYDCVK